MRLMGFASASERDWFRLLISVQGVGGKVALAILSALEPGEISRAIATGDKAMVARANGVGPKLALRIVNELKDKVGGLATDPIVGSRRSDPRTLEQQRRCGQRAAKSGLQTGGSECSGGCCRCRGGGWA